jgi:hypothetical protein
MKVARLCRFVVALATPAAPAFAQAAPAQGGSFGYARLGYGAVLAAGGSANPAIGFGYRAELGAVGFDISFLNEQIPSSNALGGESGAMAGSLLKLEGLYFTEPKGNASTYAGGGVSWGATALSSTSSPTRWSNWSGSGLQGELTMGYEWLRASPLRVFVQADAALPLYRITGQTFTYSHTQPVTSVAGHRYAPSLVFSVGMGWRRHRL